MNDMPTASSTPDAATGNALVGAEIEAIRREAELQHRYIRWTVGIFSSLVVLAAALAAFVFGNSLREVRAEIRDSVRVFVNEAVSEGTDEFARIAALRETFEAERAQLQTLRQTLDSLRFLERVSGRIDEVPARLFGRLREIERELSGGETDDRAAEPNGRPLLPEEVALEVAVLLERSNALALQRRLDPNDVFNIGIVAARLGFDVDSAQLRAIAYHLFPDPEYRIAMLAAEDLFGVRYLVENGDITIAEVPPEQVRDEAWQNALLMVSSAPPEAQTQVYSQAANIAERNASFGYYRGFIEALESVVRERSELVSAYTYATIADLESRESALGWRQRADTAWALAIAALAETSPRAQVFGPTIRSVARAAAAAGASSVEVFAAFESGGISRDVVVNALRGN